MQEEPTGQTAWWMRSDRVAGFLLLALGVCGAVQSFTLPIGSLANPGPGYAPLLLSGLMAALGAAVILTGGKSHSLTDIDWSELPHAARILSGGVFAALAIERLGYRLTVLALLVFFVGVVERRPVLTTIAVSAGVAFGTYYLFSNLLRVPLPTGPFGL